MDRYNFLKKNEKKVRDGKQERLQAKHRQTTSRFIELDLHRNVQSPLLPVVPEKKPSKKTRLELLKEWKTEKAKKLNEVKKLLKPAFVAGLLQRTATGSPRLAIKDIPPGPVPIPASVRKAGVTTRSQTAKEVTGTINKAQRNTTVKKIKPSSTFKHLTKFTTKDRFERVERHNFAVSKKVLMLQRKLTIPISPKITKSIRKTGLLSGEPKMKEVGSLNVGAKKVGNRIRRKVFPSCVIEEGIAPLPEDIEEVENGSNTHEDNRGNPMDCPKASEEMANVKTQVPEQNNLIIPTGHTSPVVQSASGEFDHVVYSPFICKQRGSSRRTSRRSSTKSVPLIERVEMEITEEEQMKRARILEFRLFLSNETSRLLGLAEKWTQLAESEGVPSEVEGDIHAVAGKSRLLTSQKFKQFEGLVDKCENGDPAVKVDDLQGFHDWVSLEVEDLDKAFDSLERRKAVNWELTQPETATRAVTKMERKTKPVKNVVKKTSVVSNLRAHILAAKQKLAGKVTCENEVPTAVVASSPKNVDSPHRKCLTSTPGGTPLSARMPLRERVLRRCSGLEIAAATSRAKSLTPGQSPVLVSPAKFDVIPAYNDSTPNRGILRQTPVITSARKTVTFPVIDPKYFLPAAESDNESPDILVMAAADESKVSSGPTPSTSSSSLSVTMQTPKSGRKRQRTPMQTPSRRSHRIAQLSAKKRA